MRHKLPNSKIASKVPKPNGHVTQSCLESDPLSSELRTLHDWQHLSKDLTRELPFLPSDATHGRELGVFHIPSVGSVRELHSLPNCLTHPTQITDLRLQDNQ